MKRRLILVLVSLLLVGSIMAAPVSASAASKVVQIMKVNVDGARMRKGPGDYDVITSLKKGTKVFYAGKHANAFYLVRTSGGKTGYVYKNYLSTYGAVNSRQVYYANGKTNLYKRASTGSKKVSTLSKHQYVIVYETRGGWAYVKTLSGKGGYVKVSSLHKA